MTTLTSYIDKDEWADLYAPLEQSHILFLFYLLFRLLERDKADQFIFSDYDFEWRRANQRIDAFSLRINVDPSFFNVLQMILERDEQVAKHITFVERDNTGKATYKVDF